MKCLFALIFSALCASSAWGIMWPRVLDTKITRCLNEGGIEHCDRAVFYWARTGLVEMGLPTAPPPQQVGVEAWGVHCEKGDAVSHIPYSDCVWFRAGHAPAVISECRTSGTSSTAAWALTPTSTCRTQSDYGSHTGASPGGECVIFGIGLDWASTISTPWGNVDATTAANGGNQFCVKPLPPNVICDVSLPSVIDHGAILAGMSDERHVDGVVNCGGSPVVTVVGTSDIIFGPGVQTKLTATMLSGTTLRVQSSLTTGSHAFPGTYNASAIIAVSPY